MGVLNVAGYFDPLLALINHGVAERFVRPNHLELLLVATSPDAVVSDLLGRVSANSEGERIEGVIGDRVSIFIGKHLVPTRPTFTVEPGDGSALPGNRQVSE